MLKIGYTLGDIGGIGPEIFLKFKRKYEDHPAFKIILVDDEFDTEKLFRTTKVGKPSPQAGEHAIKTLEKASLMAKSKDIDCLITGPVAKESLAMAGYEFSGQTEALAKINNLGVNNIEMFFILDDFRVVLGTRHVPIKDVPESLSQKLPTVIDNSFHALKKIFRIENPRLAFAGLNPHAGENGLLGKEEVETIMPFIERYKMDHEDRLVDGPFAADSLFATAAQRYLNQEKLRYDVYIAAYHDQILPLIKGIGGYRAINLTAGLPFIRASMDHGTAFDIAGKNIASSEGFKACTEFCLKILRPHNYPKSLDDNYHSENKESFLDYVHQSDS